MNYDVQRGCGFLKKGMIYSQVETSLYGKPLGYFIIDPPLEITDPNSMGISAQGISVLPRMNPMTGDLVVHPQTGEPIYDMWDWVGSEFYPEVSDFVEETRKEGMSRLTPKNTDFSKLSDMSCHILLHSKAVLDDKTKALIYNWSKNSNMGAPTCLKMIPIHDNPTDEFLSTINDTCSKMWYHTEAKALKKDDKDSRVIKISLPCGADYQMIGHIKFDPKHTLGAFMQFPIGYFTVVVDKEEDKHKEAMKALESLGRSLQSRIRLVDPSG